MPQQLTRRALLARAAAAGVAVALAPVIAPHRAFAARDSFWRMDATTQAELVRRGEVSPLELVEAAIARIERLDPALNAVVAPLFDRARDMARGPLPDGPFRGVPYLIKDLNDLAGAPTSNGSRLFAEYVAAQSEPYVARTLAAGVIPVGKSNTPEFGLIATTESLQLGPCRNPWNTEFTPGGSSGGAAAAVAAGLVPFAHATDGGGSIRIPASCCGLFGLKPSRGRLGPGEVGGGDISVQHCVSRSVRDSATLFAAAEYRGSDAVLPPLGLVTGPAKQRLRIAFSTRSYTGGAPHPDVEAAAQRAARLCADLGHEVVEAAPAIDGGQYIDAFMTVWSSFAAGVRKIAEQRGLDPAAVLEPWTLGLAALYNRKPAGAMEAAIAHFARVQHAYDAFFERYDVLLTPTLAAPPVRVGEQAPTIEYASLYERVLDWVDYTPVHNGAGNAAMSVPLGTSSMGLPIGVQFAAPQGGERRLFELAYELEAAAPWGGRWPGTV